MKKNTITIKTRTSLTLQALLILIMLILSQYFILYKQISATAYEKEKRSFEIYANQIERSLTLICHSVNNDLAKLVEGDRFKDIIADDDITNADYNYLRGEIMKTIAFNSYNSFVEINVYSKDKCLYPRNGKDILNVLGDKIEKVENLNGNTAWLNYDSQRDVLVLAKKVLLSNKDYRPGGYIIAYVNVDIMDFIKNDFASMKGAKVVLSNEYGDIAVKQSEMSETELEGGITFHKKLTNLGFNISYRIPKEVLYEGVRDVQKVMLQGILLISFLFLITSYLISYYIAHPFKDLIKVMKASKGHLKINDKHYVNYEADQFNQYYNEVVLKNQTLINDIYERDIQVLKSQLKMLQTQINPHFLYNTLESVYLSLEARKEKESAEVVFSLSQLFKYTLKADDIVFLKDEVELLTKYLQIEKYRFGDKLIWNIFVEKGTESVKIPKLLIQPIVENAVKHGVEPSNTSTEIRVSISAYEKTLLINVYDSGNGMQSDELQKLIDHQKSKEQDNGTTSLGLKNVYDRLHNYYGSGASMEINSENKKYTKVTILISNYDDIKTRGDEQ